jgi:signal peptidase I
MITATGKIAKIAAIVAFLMAGGVVLSALSGQIFLLLFALIPLIAGIGILRRRAWSAWGFSLYTLAQLPPTAFVLARSSGGTNPPGSVTAAVLAALLVPLFFFAGKSLKHAGAESGRAWPWIAISALTGLSAFFVQAFVVPTPTMEDTLLTGDRLLVQRFPEPHPQRDGLIVFHYPIDPRQTFVKRVIGVPGDRIRIAAKVVYRNGVPLKEAWAVHKTDYMDPYRDHFPGEPNTPLPDAATDMLKNHVSNGEVIVPPGKYFVLGDNRDNSLDSRYWGFIDSGNLIGRPLLIYDSEEQSGNRSIRWGRLLKLL